MLSCRATVGHVRRTRARGLTLIELLTVLTLVGILLALGIPGFGTWIRDTRVRTVSEDIANGLRLAQAEAVARNRQVVLVRTTANPARNASASSSGGNWYVQVLPLNSAEAGDADFIASSYINGGSFAATNGASIGGVASVCFNSVGRVVARSGDLPPGANCTAPGSATTPMAIDVSLAGSSFVAATPMRVELFLGGRTRLCNTKAASGQVNACS